MIKLMISESWAENPPPHSEAKQQLPPHELAEGGVLRITKPLAGNCFILFLPRWYVGTGALEYCYLGYMMHSCVFYLSRHHNFVSSYAQSPF